MAERVVFLLLLIAGAFPTWLGTFFAYGLTQTLLSRTERREFLSQPWSVFVVVVYTAGFLLGGGFLLFSAFTYGDPSP